MLHIEFPEFKKKRSAPATTCLIVLNVLIAFMLPVIFKQQYPYNPVAFGANWGPLTLNGQWWRLISSAFIHIEVLHLTANMLVLYYAGRRIEPILGSSLFLFIYLGCAVAAGIVVLTMDPNSGSYGASAGVAGIAGALMLYYLHGLRETWQHHKKKFLAFGLLAIYIMSNDLWGYSHGVHAIAFAVGMVLTLIVARLRCARWQVLIGFLFVTLLTTFAMVVSHWHQRL